MSNLAILGVLMIAAAVGFALGFAFGLLTGAGLREHAELLASPAPSGVANGVASAAPAPAGELGIEHDNVQAVLEGSLPPWGAHQASHQSPPSSSSGPRRPCRPCAALRRALGLRNAS